MPKSKRVRVVSTSRTQKKDRKRKEELCAAIQESIDRFCGLQNDDSDENGGGALYAFVYRNMRNAFLKSLREEWKDVARIYMGSNKVMQRALGTSEDDEFRKDLHKISNRLVGFCGLICSTLSQTEVEEKMEQMKCPVPARTGQIVNETVVLPQGPLEGVAHSLEPTLRKHGLPTKLNKGVVELLSDHTVCKKSQQAEPLSPDQTVILKLLGMELGYFELKLVATWRNGEYTEIMSPDEVDAMQEGEPEEEDE